MDFTLSAKDQQLVATAREFAQHQVRPLARELDRTSRFPSELVRGMGALGLMGIYVPEHLGGAGCSALAYNLAVLEISKACASTGVILSAHTSLCVDSILKYGSVEQHFQYLRPLATGAKLGAFALTEPGCGSDVAHLDSTFIHRGTHFELSGTKKFVTNGGFADVYVICATSDKTLGGKGISAFIVEPTFPGFTRGKTEEKLGIKASSTTEIILDRCIVPKENLLGPLGKGFSIALAGIDGGRIGIASQSIGIGRAALEAAVAYVKTRKQFGAPLADLQAIQWMIADSATELDAAELLMLRAAKIKDLASETGQRFTREAAMAKLFASEAAGRVCDRALQMLGGYGYMQDSDVERHYRDVRICRLYEGTSEIQRVVIAGSVLRDS